MTTATLGFAIQSDTAVAAKERLDQMSGASKRAQAATDALNSASQRSASGTRALAQAANMVTAAQSKAAAATKATTMAYQAQAASMGAVAARSRNLSFQLIDIGQALVTAPTMGIYALQNLGFQVAQIGQLYMGQGGFNQAIKDSARQIGVFAARMGPLAAVVGLVAGAFAGMTYEINRTSDVSVGFGDVLRATVEVAADAIANQLKPAIDAVAPAIGAAWDWIVEKTKWLGNTIINSFRAVGSDIAFIYEQLPNIVGSATVVAANAVIGGIEMAINKASGLLDQLIEKANGVLAKLPGGLQIPSIGGVEIGRIENVYAQTLGAANEQHKKAIEQIFASDPLGDSFAAIADRARELAAATDEVGKAAGRATDPWKGLRKATEKASEAFKFARDMTKGFLSDLYQGLKSGEGFWKSFANAASNAIDKIVDKLLDNLVNALFQVNSAGQSVGGGGGGIFGAILGGIGSLFGFANGGYTGSGGRNQPAGIVHGGEYVFSKAATDRLGVRNLDALHRRAKGYADGGYVPANNNQPQAANQSVAVDVRVWVDDDGKIRAVAEQAADSRIRQASPVIVNAAVGEMSKNSAGMITSAQRRKL